MKKAFTLIELLVVIAIIAILAAILFPVFAQAKAAAKKTAALSNVKQLATGVQIYLGDSDDVYPFGIGWNDNDTLNENGYAPGPYGGWSRSTSPYIKSIGIFRDGSDPLTVTMDPSYIADDVNKYHNTQMISMIANGYSNYCPQTQVNDLMGLMGYATKSQFGTQRIVVNATGFDHIADTILLAERFGSDNGFGDDSVLVGNRYQDTYYPVAGDIPDNSLAANTPYNKPAPNAHLVDNDQRYGAVSHPYGTQSVFAFTDGHAKTMDPRATNPSTYGQQDKNLWNSLR